MQSRVIAVWSRVLDAAECRGIVVAGSWAIPRSASGSACRRTLCLAPFGTGGTLRCHSADNEVAPGLFSARVLVPADSSRGSGLGVPVGYFLVGYFSCCSGFGFCPAGQVS